MKTNKYFIISLLVGGSVGIQLSQLNNNLLSIEGPPIEPVTFKDETQNKCKHVYDHSHSMTNPPDDCNHGPINATGK